MLNLSVRSYSCPCRMSCIIYIRWCQCKTLHELRVHLVPFWIPGYAIPTSISARIHWAWMKMHVKRMNQLSYSTVKLTAFWKGTQALVWRSSRFRLNQIIAQRTLVISTSGFRKLLHQGLNNSHLKLSHLGQSTISHAQFCWMGVETRSSIFTLPIVPFARQSHLVV